MDRDAGLESEAVHAWSGWMTAVGVNLSGISYYSTEEPFLDRLKTSQWFEETATGWQPLGSDAAVDANGYPTRMAAAAKSYVAEFGVDPTGPSPTGHIAHD